MTTLRFSGSLPWWLILTIGVVSALLVARWYWRESKHLSTPMRWVLPACRGTAFFLILFMLAGPTLYLQRIQGELSRIRVLLDTSSSMSTADASPKDLPRMDCALGWLLGGKKGGASQGWLNELRHHHRVDLLVSNHAKDGPVVWDSQLSSRLPDAESITTHGASSALGEFLLGAILLGAKSKSALSSNEIAAVVLISDGQSNMGLNMMDAASRYVDEKVPIFTIGVGGVSEPEDLGIMHVEHSQRVYRSDRLRGTIQLKERVKSGTYYGIEVQHLGKTVFAKRMQSLDQGMRRVEFDIPADGLVEVARESAPQGFTYSALPIDLKFSVNQIDNEISFANNSYSTSLWGVEKKNRVLILDRRGGWEMRYIKNAFERDAAWDSVIAIGRGDSTNDVFPSTRNALFEFDLILASFDTLRSFGSEQQAWISDFVSLTGGGLVVVDSKRERAFQAMEAELSAFMPIRFYDSAANILSKSLRLNASAENQPAFQIGSNEMSNVTTWSQLPSPKSYRSITLAPGSESMVEIMSDNSKPIQPLVATKLFGQGRVLYFATDETWRWRYEVADHYHQRFWSQIATWAMRMPFAVNDSFASLDSGIRVYSPADSISIRARLKREDSRPLVDASANVVLERNGQRHVALPLDQDRDARGFYRATLGPMPEGSYRVRLEVAGVPTDALGIETQFVVQPSADIELQTLACNRQVLRQTAELTGGEFIMLDETTSLSKKLNRFRTGSIVESQTQLWQSYPWFATIVGLLSIEWYLRKRAGLV